MPAFRPVVFVGGILVLILAALMVIPALYEWAAGAARASQYLPCIAVPAFLGTVAVLGPRGGPLKLGLREVYLLPSSVWFVLPLTAPLPFLWPHPPPSLSD